MVHAIAEWELPVINHVRIQPDRRRIIDFDIVDWSALTAKRIQRHRDNLSKSPPPSEEVWSEVVADVAALVAKLHARGVKVVFVKYPVTGAWRELEDEFFPREKYWDTFARGVGTDTIHYRDVPEAAGLDCPDGSHLSSESAIIFTKVLERLLVERGVID